MHGIFDRKGAVHVHQLRKVLPIDEFHDQENRPGSFVRVKRGYDVRVVELARHLDFPLESFERPIGTRHRRREFLQRDQTFHAAVPGLENTAHASLADFVEDDIIAQDQPRSAPGVNTTCLIFGDLARVHQPPCQYLYRILGLCNLSVIV